MAKHRSTRTKKRKHRGGFLEALSNAASSAAAAVSDAATKAVDNVKKVNTSSTGPTLADKVAPAAVTPTLDAVDNAAKPLAEATTPDAVPENLDTTPTGGRRRRSRKTRRKTRGRKH